MPFRNGARQVRYLCFSFSRLFRMVARCDRVSSQTHAQFGV